MRRLLALALVAATAACARGPAASAPAPLASPADSTAVVGTLTRMFDALRKKNVPAFQAEFHPAARFTLIRPAPGGGDSVRVMVLPLAQFVQAALGPNGNGVDEPIRNVRVTVDGPLATAWAEYQADSFRQTGCGARWP
ncbi:MAG: hypothetical protein MUF53_12290 [Gemmatimonadaceae bacterium]|nr:hypothetical protein [Gemmatimonadaceae bacterium]